MILSRCEFSVEGGLSTIISIQCVKLRLSSACKSSKDEDAENNDEVSLVDLEYVDEEALILLIKNESK